MTMSDFNEAEHPRGLAGKFTDKPLTDAPDGVITDTVLLNTWPGAGATLNGDLAAKVVPGAAKIQIRENEDGSTYAETTFDGVDLEGHIGDAFFGSDMGDTTEEWIAEHEFWVRDWFRDRNITVAGDWPRATIVHISDLPEDAATFHDVTAAFNESLSGPSLRDAVSGEFPLFWQELESDIRAHFCNSCFGQLDNPGDDYCDTCTFSDEDED